MDMKRSSNKTGFKKAAKDYIITIIAAAFIALTFRSYVFARADVDGESMMSTLQDKDVIFVEKLSVLTHRVKRGQIIIFNSKNYNNDIYVKRIVAVSGDEIELKDGKVFLNGKELKEDYLDKSTVTEGGSFLGENEKYKIPEGHVFVLGDNRENSIDSRILGSININDIKGRAIVRVYPLSHIKIF